MSHNLDTKQGKHKPGYGRPVPISGEPGSRAGLASGTVSCDFFRVCRSAKASASGARDGFPGRESSTPQPRPLDLGLASESGDSDFQLSLCIMLSGRQLHENKKCILMPHHLQACEMPTQRGLSVFVCVLGDFLSPK